MTTPAQAKGLIVNVTRVRSRIGYGETVFVLSEDDGSNCPFFRKEGEPVGVNSVCLGLDRVEILPPLPVPMAPVLTGTVSDVQDSGPAPDMPQIYTELQRKTLDTFQRMYDAAVAHREGRSSRLNSDYGICDNIERFSEQAGTNPYQMSEVKENLIRLTPNYSGSYSYPVPAPDGGDASLAFSRNSNKWTGAYGLERLTQLGHMIDIIKSDKWSDDLIERKTPAFRNGLVVGDVVRYTRRDEPSFWVFRRDDESMAPSFHRLTDVDDYTDLDLNYVVKVDKDTISKPRAVSEFLSELEEQAKKKAEIERQVAELTEALKAVKTDIALLDYGLADQHKVKRIAA